MTFDKQILRKYAQQKDPEKLPKAVYFHHTEHAVTIFDLYPKAIFHFLVLPRLRDNETRNWNARNLTSLKALLNSSSVKKEDALELLRYLKEEADHVKAECIKEMKDNWGCSWDIHIGFHAVQSMDHIHLHIISDDLYSETLKTKKHYNSFHPKLGFFLHLDEVLSWFEADVSDTHFKLMAKLDAVKYEKLLKEPLRCHQCDNEQKNMPTLKAHLAAHHKIVLERHKRTERNKEGLDGKNTERHPESTTNELSLKRKASDLDKTENDVLSEAPPRKTAASAHGD